MDLVTRLREKVIDSGRRVVLPEGEDLRVIEAAVRLRDERLAQVVLLGERETIQATASSSGMQTDGIVMIDPRSSNDFDRYVDAYGLRRQLSTKIAARMIRRPLFFGGMMVAEGHADTMVAGVVNATAVVIQAGALTVGYADAIETPSSFFLMILPSRSDAVAGEWIFADCAVNIAPTPAQLADIAVASGNSAARLLADPPRVAMLSFSTDGSAAHEAVDKVTQALELARAKSSTMAIDGEFQADTALVPAIAERKLQRPSPVAGQANVLVFPDLNSANIAYKLTQYLAGAQAIGPFLQGFAKPISDLSRGASVDDIVATTVVCLAQCSAENHEITGMSDTDPNQYRPLTQSEIQTLRLAGCSADDWRRVQVAEPFLPERIVDAQFSGDVRIGSLSGQLTTTEGSQRPAGIYRAQLIDCQLADNVRIASVSGHLAHYRIGEDVQVEGVGRLICRPDARFGNGIEIETLNEGGGREVVLFNRLSAQMAYLMCLYRHNQPLISQLQRMALDAAGAVTAGHGTIASGTRITDTTKIVDVAIGPAAIIDGATSLVNGTILSHSEAPTVIGAGVIAEDFIIAEGACVSDAAMLKSTFVGQAARVGKQFSAEGSLFFANCEAFHGEACSIFAGPYTVTHHKASLLIGGMFSFFNAGSATNQSNHRYKLGPSHEGKMERGCKTGSSSYLMWPCRVGPFSVVLGKHTRTFDTADMPFSHVEADSAGRCTVIPGHYIATVGTLRDGRKWPSRDRRRGAPRRDLISFPVFSPLTVGRMIRGAERLADLAATTDRSKESVTVDGVEIKRVLLRSGRKRYAAHVELYLRERIVDRLDAYSGDDLGLVLSEVLAAPSQGMYSDQWVDVAGLLVPQARLGDVLERICDGAIADVDQLYAELAAFQTSYADDEWVWVRRKTHELLGLDLDRPDHAAILELIDDYAAARDKFLQLILIDVEREFDEASRIGYGLDGDSDEAARDFAAVRGEFPENSFVREVHAEIAAVQSKCAELRQRLGAATSGSDDC